MLNDQRWNVQRAKLQKEERAKIAQVAEQSRNFPTSLVGENLLTLPGSLSATEIPGESGLLPAFDFPPLPTVTWTDEDRAPTTPSELIKRLPVIHRTLSYAEREALVQNPRSSDALRQELYLGWLQYEPYSPGIDTFYPENALAYETVKQTSNTLLPMHSFRSSFNASKIEAMQERVTAFNRVRSIAFSMHEEAAKAVLFYVLSFPEGDLLLKQVRPPAMLRLTAMLREVLIITVEDPPPNQFLQSVFGRLGEVRGYRQRSPQFLIIKAALLIMDSLQFSPLLMWPERMQDLTFYECCRRMVSEIVLPVTIVTAPSPSIPTSESSTHLTVTNPLTDPTTSMAPFILPDSLMSHLDEAYRLSTLINTLFQSYKTEDGIDSYIINEERNRNLIAQQQRKGRMEQSHYLNFYLLQTRIHRIYASSEEESFYHVVPQKQFQTGFPHYKMLIRQKNIDALMRKLHGDALFHDRNNDAKPNSIVIKQRKYQPRRHQGLSYSQMYHYLSDIKVPPCYMRCLKADPVLSSVFRPLPHCQKEVFYYRSSIHGFGLFLAEPGQRRDFITEYSGDIVSSLVADVRERLYTEAGLKSVYMFSIKSNCIIDTTLRGNFGRFLNHSCSPTAESLHAKFSFKHSALEPVSTSLQSQGIAIFMVANLAEGSEVTQDYYLSKESADNKLFCECGSARCRLYMN